MTSRRTVLALLAGVPLVATGCVSVPTGGPVAPVSPSGRAPQRGGAIEPRPPADGALPQNIVDGFLNAIAASPGDLASARQFLVPELADSWKPEGVVIYPDTESPEATASSVVLSVDRVFGQLDVLGSFSRVSGTLNQDFGLRLVDGQWRIGTPPTTLLLSRQFFSFSYQPYLALFYDATFRRLVPDPIFLPYADDDTPLAAALIQRLLQGPSAPLRTSVRSALPSGTQLQGQSVVVRNGVADFSLGDPVLTLDQAQRDLLAAQLALTLAQVEGLRGFRLNGGQVPFSGTTGEGADTFYPIEAARRYAPVPDLTPALFGLQGTKVVTVDQVNDRAEVRPLNGPLGAGRSGLRSLAVGLASSTIAVLTDDQQLLSGPLSAEPQRVLSGRGRLLRPQLVDDELWTVGRRDGVDTIWVIRDGTALAVRAPLTDLRVTAFRIAPDGGRIAVVRQTDSGSELGVMAIDRSSERTALGPWRGVDLDDLDAVPDLRTVVDVGWRESTTLMLLASTGPDATVDAYAASQDGYSVSAITSSRNWGARQLAVAPTDPVQAVVLGADTTSYTLTSEEPWGVFANDLRFLAFSG